MNKAFDSFLNSCTCYVETGLRHGYPLKELMWVILSTKTILSLETRTPVMPTDVLKRQHNQIVERYKKKVKGSI